MPDHLLYLVIDAGVLSIPFIASFHPRIRFDKRFVPFLKASIPVALLFIVWDIVFTLHGVWGFNERYITGIELVGLPVEEWLFFFCIPFACVFVYHCFGLLQIRFRNRWFYAVTGIAGLALVAVAGMHPDKAYTALTCFLTGSSLAILGFQQKPGWLPRAVVAYLAVLPFFFISNGLLTGSWIPEQVVWYNDAENLGIRMGTIPVEDTAYGFLLVLLNILLLEYFSRKPEGFEFQPI